MALNSCEGLRSYLLTVAEQMCGNTVCISGRLQQSSSSEIMYLHIHQMSNTTTIISKQQIQTLCSSEVTLICENQMETAKLFSQLKYD